MTLVFQVSNTLTLCLPHHLLYTNNFYKGLELICDFLQEPGALPFIPNIRSQFQHVFIIVRAHNPCSENTQYR